MRKPENEPSLEELGLTPESCKVSELRPADWLEGPGDFAAYLNDALDTGDPAVVARCLKQIAQVTGATLPENLMPGIASLLDMLRGMNVQLRARETECAEPAVA